MQHLLRQLCCQPLHLLAERLVIVVRLFSTHVAPRRKHVTMLGNLSQLYCPAEARHIGICLSGACLTIPTPPVHRASDAVDVLVSPPEIVPRLP